MKILGRSALWIGCTALVVAFLATEQLVSGAGSLRWPEKTATERADQADQASAEANTDAATSDTNDTGTTAAAETEVTAAAAEKSAKSAKSESTRASKQSRSEDAATHSTKMHRTYRVTAYCDRGKTASGIPSGVGQCAAPEDIPFGSKIYIPELNRTFIVTDRTHRRFRHNTVDIFMPKKTDCREFGLNYFDCEVSVIDEEPAYGKISVAQ